MAACSMTADEAVVILDSYHWDASEAIRFWHKEQKKLAKIAKKLEKKQKKKKKKKKTNDDDNDGEEEVEGDGDTTTGSIEMRKQ